MTWSAVVFVLSFLVLAYMLGTYLVICKGAKR